MLASPAPETRGGKPRSEATREGERRMSDRFVTRVVALAVAAVLAYVVFLIFRPFIGSIVWAVLIAYLLFPLVIRLRRRLGGRPTLAAVIMTLLVIVGFGLPAAVLAAAFAGQAVELGQRLTHLAQEYQIQAPEDLVNLPIVGRALEWLDAMLPVSAAQIQTWAVRALQKILQFLMAHGGAWVAGAFGVVGNLSLMLFILFFLFRDGDEMAGRALRLIPMEPARKERLFRHLGDVMRAVVFGTIITAIAQGSLIGIACWITGMQSPVVIGALAAIASFIPFVGTSLVVVPCVIYLMAQGIAWKWIFFLVWGVLVAGSADNVLRPALVSGRAQIGTLTAFFGVIGGLSAFGIVGLFLGPVVLALVLALLQFAEEMRILESPAPKPG
jgi:predicted PurR-regulated permease PerM